MNSFTPIFEFGAIIFVIDSTFIKRPEFFTHHPKAKKYFISVYPKKEFSILHLIPLSFN